MDNKGTMIYKVAFSIYLATTMLEASLFGFMSVFGMVIKAMRYLSYGMLLWKILAYGSYTSRQLLKYAICMAIVFLNFLVAKDRILLFLMLFLIAGADIKFSEVVKQALIVNGCCMLAIIFFGRLGVLPDRIYVEGVERIRYSLGFDFTTTSSNLFLYWILIYIFMRKERIHAWEIVILESINYMLFRMTDTRNAFTVSSAALAISLLLKYWKEGRLRKIYEFLIKYITEIGVIVIGLLIFLYDKVEFVREVLDPMLNTRITLSYEAINTYGLKWLGNPIEWIGATFLFETEEKLYNYVDSSYIQILLNYGILVIAILLVAYSLLGREIVRKKEWYFGLVIVCSAVHSTFDPQLLRINYNVFILALGYLFLTGREERDRYLFE